MSDPAFVQLMDMGIPGGRARAALVRSKGDAMSAAERVFAGEFDDIPSDDEGGDQATGLLTPEELPSKPMIHAAKSRKGKEVITIDDSDEDMGGDGDEDIAYDESDEENGFDDGFEDDDERLEDKPLSDPYAGIFFSKDRIETILEPVEKEVYARITVPGGEKKTVRILGRGEWMSGCPEGNEQSFLFQLYSLLAEGEMLCSAGCGHKFQRQPQDFFALLPDFSSFTKYLDSHIHRSCPRCHQATCLACGENADRNNSKTRLSTSVDIDQKGKQPKTTGHERLLHCPNLQGVLLGVGLHMIEQAFLEGNGSHDLSTSSSSSGSAKLPPSKKQKFGVMLNFLNKTSLQAQSDDDEPGLIPELPDPTHTLGLKSRKIAHPSGTGYAGSGSEDTTGQRKAEEAQGASDKKTALLLSQVRVFLPDLDRPGGARSSDHLVHPTALAHLRRRSAFVNDLLRNDSLLDMSNRSVLYRTLFDWLEVVSNHEALASMLAMPQMRPVSAVPCNEDPDSVSVTYEGSPSPRELLENCVIQAQAALKGLQAVDNISRAKDDTMTEEDVRLSRAELEKAHRERVEEEKGDANLQLRIFCERIVSSARTIDKSLIETKGKPFVDRMRESLPRLPETGASVEEQVVKGQTDEATIRIYEEWAGRARFQYCDLTVPTSEPGEKKAYRHAFDGSIQSLEGMDMPRRSLAIAKELAILTTSLPVAWHSTIFLRVDETRVDALKAMIIGPEGTPYENGCFIFDIFLPLDYNQRCPSVKFMTTNGGRFRLNPNLYADGKVCLSLLGTWQGPGWISGQSTLLQVLISIQSLILCEEPYCNEPAWSNDAGTPASKAYSANVRRMVIVDAMANNIKTPPYPFENEIKTHFRLKSKSIREQIDKWKSLDDGKPCPGVSGQGLDYALNEMKRLLDELDSDTQKDPTIAKSLEGSVKEERRSGRLAKVFGTKKRH